MPAGVGGSDTAQAAGLASAALGANLLALLFTVVFARLLGASDYGSLAALLSTYIILSVPGSALQVAAARETAMGRLGRGGAVAATVAHWMHRLTLITLASAVIGVLAREPLATAIGVEETWAAAAIPVTGCAWVLLCVMRGVLQGLHAYRPVGLSIIGEATGRLALRMRSSRSAVRSPAPTSRRRCRCWPRPPLSSRSSGTAPAPPTTGPSAAGCAHSPWRHGPR